MPESTFVSICSSSLWIIWFNDVSRKKEREKDSSKALADLSKLGNLGALTGLEIEEEEEEEEVFDQTYEDSTTVEEDRQNSVSIRWLYSVRFSFDALKVILLKIFLIF